MEGMRMECGVKLARVEEVNTRIGISNSDESKRSLPTKKLTTAC